MPEPVCRARHLKTLLDGAYALPEVGSRVRQVMGFERLQQITDAASSDWLPFELDLAVTHALHEALPPEGFRAFMRAHQSRGLEGPIFRFLVEGARGLFGVDTGAWARWIPRAWELVFKHCGRWELGPREPFRLELALHDLPDAGLEQTWLASVADSLSAVLPATGAVGEFTLQGFDPATRRASYLLVWGPRPA